VYAFGILLNQMMTDTPPYHLELLALALALAAAAAAAAAAAGYQTDLKKRIVAGVRPSPVYVDRSGPNGTLGTIIKQCWDGDPLKRPTFGRVLHMLDGSAPNPALRFAVGTEVSYGGFVGCTVAVLHVDGSVDIHIPGVGIRSRVARSAVRIKA
jgi:hypothetical protein